MRCKKHPKYSGKRKYTPYCRQCRKIFIDACHKRIANALKDHFKFICRNGMDHRGLPRKIDMRVKIHDNLVFDADTDIPNAEIK